MFTIYTKKPNGDQRCKYCDWSKELLNKNNLKFTEIECETAPWIFKELNHTSYPLIFKYIGEGATEYVGGYDELQELLMWEDV